MNKEQFHGWKNDPITVEVMEKLEELKTSLGDSLISGNTVCTTVDETALLTAAITGKIQGLNQLLGLEFKEDFEEEENGK